jgi:hypothetical protein
MAKPKGSIKEGGRTKGVPNKTTAKAKELILQAIDTQSVAFNEVMGTLKEDEPREWAKIMVKLMDFVLPKKIDVTTDGDKVNNIPVVNWMPKDDKPKSSI